LGSLSIFIVFSEIFVSSGSCTGKLKTDCSGSKAGMETVSDRDIEKFYQTLELPMNSSQAEVKAAYRSLARKYHPDRFTGDPSKLKASEEYCKRLNVAYDFLKTYDPPAQKGKSTTSKFNVEVQTARNPSDRTPAVFVRQAQHFQSIGKLQDALMALDTAIALEDDYYPAYELRSEVRFALGNAYGSGMDLKRAKHYRWVYQSEGRSIDSPTKSQSSSGTAARDAAKAAVDSVFKTQNRSKSSSEPSKQPQSSPPSKKPTPDKSSSASKSPTSTPTPTPTPTPKTVDPQPELRQVFPGHVDSISQILFVNRSLISASHDGTVRIWCSETGTQQGYLAVGAAVTAIATSPNSNLFITGDRSGKIKMWNLVDYKLIRSIPLHTGKVTGIHFTLNGKGFVTTGEDGILKIFQLNPASLRHTLQIANVPIFCSALMGDRIFTASADSQLRMILQGKITHTEPLSSPMSKTMAANTDRKWVAIGDDRGSVHCFDAQGNLHKSFVGCSGRIQSVNFLSSGKKLLVVGETPLIKIWDTTTWNLCTEWNVIGTGQLTTAQVQGNQIAIAQGNSLQLWQLP
jgi:COMPASS component SWD3